MDRGILVIRPARGNGLRSAVRLLTWLLATAILAVVALEAHAHIHGISDPDAAHTQHSVSALAQVQQGFTLSPITPHSPRLGTSFGRLIPRILACPPPVAGPPDRERAPPFRIDSVPLDPPTRRPQAA